MEISAKLVKELRERTGAGLMECKQALKESDADIEKAIKYLQEKGILKAAKKSGRETKEGRISIAISSDGKSGAIVEINCETDFVSRNDDFASATQSITEKILSEKISSIDSIPDSIQNELKALISRLGENMSINNIKSMTTDKGYLTSYIHQGGQIGVLLSLEANSADSYSKDAFHSVAKDVSMHIAAMNPLGLKKEDIDPEMVEQQRNLATKQAEESGKPEKIIPKIVEGKMGQFYKEMVLLEQAFVKEPKQSVQQFIDSESKKFNDKVQVIEFARFKVGE